MSTKLKTKTMRTVKHYLMTNKKDSIIVNFCFMMPHCIAYIYPQRTFTNVVS